MSDEIIGEATLSPYEVAIDPNVPDPETLLTFCLAMPETSPLNEGQLEKLGLVMGKTAREFLSGNLTDNPTKQRQDLAFQLAIFNKGFGADNRVFEAKHARSAAGARMAHVVIEADGYTKGLKEQYELLLERKIQHPRTQSPPPPHR